MPCRPTKGEKMAYTTKKLEDLNVIDDFLMNSLASDGAVGENFCRVLLSTLLQREIGKVDVTVQKVVPPKDPELKGIRLDVKVEEPVTSEEGDDVVAMNIYDVEPHLTSGTDLPRHNRFYQALTDSGNMKSGEKDYKLLPNLYILMILNKDPFGYDYMMYSIRNKCDEVEELEYEDGLRFYYFNTSGNKGGSDAIKTMLRYIRDSRAENATDAATKEIHSYAERVKIRPEVRKNYMFWEEYEERLREEIADAIRDDIRNEVLEEFNDAEKDKIREKLRDSVKEELIGTEKEEVRKAGKVEDILELLEDYGKIPAKLQEKIFNEDDMAVLKRWHKLAAKVNSIEEFEKELKIQHSI